MKRLLVCLLLVGVVGCGQNYLTQAPCLDCGEVISKRAIRCPRCGAPLPDFAALAELKGRGTFSTRNDEGHVEYLSFDEKVYDYDLKHLSGMTELKELLLDSHGLTSEGLPDLKGLTKLERLNIRDNRITDVGFEHLQGLINLRDLRLGNNRITGDGLVHLKGLTGLQDLSLENNQITDAGLVHLKGLTGLNRLYLRGNQINGTGVDEIRKSLNPCYIVF